MLPPHFEALALRRVDGAVEKVFPAKDRRATVVFVVLAECPIARGFSPEMARIAREYGKKGVRCVMAFADGSPTTIKSQMKAFGLLFPAARTTPTLMKMLVPQAAPTAAIIGADGTVAYVGRIDDRFPALGVQRKPRRADLRLALDQFLAGKPVVPSWTPVIGCAFPNVPPSGRVIPA